jgi:hypothetical protein
MKIANKLIVKLIFSAIGLSVLAERVEAQPTYTLAWGDQFGTTEQDTGSDVTVDEFGYAYVAGSAAGALSGSGPSNVNAFLRKYSPDGSVIWTRQNETGFNPGNDFNSAFGVSADGMGSVYLSGQYNTLDPSEDIDCCETDFYVAKYDLDGNLAWTRTLSGTVDNEEFISVSADRLGNVFVTGTTYGSLARPIQGSSDGFVVKYNSAGDLQWIQQFGTGREDDAFGVAADGLGNVYVSGRVDQNAPSTDDAYLTKFDGSGNRLWTRTLGDPDGTEIAWDVFVDEAGGVFIAGQTDFNFDLGPFPILGTQPFVAKYDENGVNQWVKLVGDGFTPGRAYGVVADSAGRIQVSGQFDGIDTTGFAATLSADGNLIGVQEFTAGSSTRLWDIAADGINLYATGWTNGSLFGPAANPPGIDAIVLRLVVPEPSTLSLAAFVGFAVLSNPRFRTS